MLDASIVDQNIEAAQLMLGEGHHVGNFVSTQHIGGMIAHAAAGSGFQLGTDTLNLGRVAEPVEDDIAPGGHDRPGQSQADARG